MYKIPAEYEAIGFLQASVGDIKVAEYFCIVHNKLNAGSTLRVKSTNANRGEIVLTGKCPDVKLAIDYLKYIISVGILVTHEKTIMEVEV